MADLALRPLTLGELLDRAFSIFRRRFGAILMVLVVSLIFPSLMLLNNIRTFANLGQFATPGGSAAAQTQMMFAIFAKLIWMVVVFAVCLLIARTALGWITHKAMLGEDTDAFDAFTHAFKLFFPMLGLLVVEVGITIAAEIVLYLPTLALGLGNAAALGRPGVGLGIGFAVWMVAYFVAMLYLFASLFVTTSILIAEADTGVLKSIERSWTLTKGRRWNIVGAMVLIYVLVWVVMVGIAVAIGVGMGLSHRGPEAAGGMMVAMFGGMILLGILVYGYYFVLQMVTYYDLRVRKEGLDLELASAAMPSA